MKKIISIVIILLIATVSHASTILIPADYLTIQEGIDVSIDGDTILVSAGNYIELLTFQEKAIAIISIEGPYKTFISAHGNTVNMDNILNGPAELNGFSFGGQVGYNQGKISVVNSQDVTIKNNIIHHIGNWDEYGYSPIGYGITAISSQVQLSNNVFHNDKDNYEGVIPVQAFINIDTNCVNTIISNNTFYETYRGVRILSDNVTIVNNIFSENSIYAIHVDSNISNINADFNLYWNNTENYNSVITTGTNDIALDPEFLQLSSGRFYIDSISPCLDSGDPSSQYNDPDNSQNDIGAIPFGPLPSPPPTDLQVSDIYIYENSVNNLLSFTPTLSWTPSVDINPDDSAIYQGATNHDPDFNIGTASYFTPTINSSSIVEDSLHGGALFYFSVYTINKYNLTSISESTVGYFTWRRGDISLDGIADITDLVEMVDFMFNNGPLFLYPERADLDADCIVDISDLVLLVSHIFTGAHISTLQYGCQ